MPRQPRHLAMLIDGDNAQYSLLKEMVEEVSRYGTVTVRRAYGDWTQPNLANWRSWVVLLVAGGCVLLALFVGLALSLSSTAMVLQVLKETGELELRQDAPFEAIVIRAKEMS